MSLINFYSEDIQYRLRNKKLINKWLLSAIESESGQVEEISFIFTSDNFLINLNTEYLSHDTFTDIITFQYNEEGDKLHSDVFVSIERVKDNAKLFNQSILNELHRMLIHGVLHLLGYDDKNKTSKQLMTTKEDYYLSLRPERLLSY